MLFSNNNPCLLPASQLSGNEKSPSFTSIMCAKILRSEANALFTCVGAAWEEVNAILQPILE